MRTRCSRLVPVLIKAMWYVIRLVRAVMVSTRRVRILWISPRHMVNGMTFGVMIVIVRRRYVSPVKGKENGHADR